jgi:hypothetical protein
MSARIRNRCLFLLGLAGALLFPNGGRAIEGVGAFLEQHCASCHNPEKRKGKLDLLPVVRSFGSAEIGLLKQIGEVVQQKEMPPEDETQPTATERSGFLEQLRLLLGKREASHRAKATSPGLGNLVDHKTLFTEPAMHKAATPARLWRMSPHIFMQHANSMSRSPLLRAKKNQGGDGLHPAFAYMTPPHTFRDHAEAHAFEEATTELLFDICWQIAGLQTSRPNQHKTIREFGAKKRPTKAEWKKLIRVQFGFALKRIPNDEELGMLYSLGEKTRKQSTTKEALHAVLAAILLKPDAVYRFELGHGEPDEFGRVLLAPYELMTAISFALTDKHADNGLKAAADSGNLNNATNVQKQIARLLDGDAANDRLIRFFQEYFEYPRVKEVFKDARSGGLIFANHRIDDADRFVQRILANDRDVLRRLLTDDRFHVLANGIPDHPVIEARARKYYLGDYGFPREWDWTGPQPQKAPIGKRSGILTHPAWLLAFSDNEKNQAIQRGRWIYTKLLGGVVPDTPIGVDAQFPTDPHLTLREKMKVTRKEYCWTCHQRMDPLGLPLEQFDDFGRHRVEELQRPVVTTGRIAIGDPELDGPVKDPFELMARLSRSKRVEQVFVRHAFRYFLGRNETLDDAPTLIDAHRAYQKNRGSVKALVTSLLTSDSFLYRRLSPKASSQP